MKRDFFLIALAFAMATGSFVLIEPAPVDLAVTLLILTAVISRKLSFRHSHEIPFGCFVAFIIANLLSVPNAVDSTRAVWYSGVTVYLGLSMMFFIGIMEKYGRSALEAIMNGYTLAGLLSTLLAIAAYFQLIPFEELLLLYGRPKGLFKDPNVFGPYLVPVCLYAFTSMETKDSGRRAWHWVFIFAVCSAGVFFSFSRACWINFLASMAAYAGFTILTASSLKEKLRWMQRIVSMAVLAILVVGVALMDERVTSMLALRVGSQGLQGYDELRFNTQRRALESARQNMLGVGPGQSEDEFGHAPHSSYIRVVAENGVLGLLSFVALLVTSFLRSVQAIWKQQDPFWRNHARVTAACLLGLLINSFVIDSFHWRHMWLLLSFAWVSPGEPVSDSIRIRHDVPEVESLAPIHG